MHKMGDLAVGSPELLPYQQEWLALQLQYEKVLGKRLSDLGSLPIPLVSPCGPMLVACLP